MLGLLQILGGLALFLFGIKMLSGGMEKLAGEQIQKWLDRATRTRFKSAVFGTVATALIQSSGLLMVMMIGLINANLMSVEQAIGVMLGQEIGTTLTAQIVAFEIGNYRLILVILGFILIEFFEHRDWKKYGEILFGLGIIFIGMSFMSNSLNDLIKIAWVNFSLVEMGQYPLLAVFAGLILTSITQSSTAVTSLVVAMGISHVITLQGAVGLILGANIGSCITGLIAAIRLSPAAKRASIAQILINVIGVLIFVPFISQYASFVSHTASELPRQIANAHTIFNVAVSAALFPFVKQIARVTKWLVPDSPPGQETKLTAYIDEMQFSVPAVALNEASRELVRLGEGTVQMLEQSCLALINQDAALARKVMEQEDGFVDPVFKTVVDFVNKLLLQEDLTPSQKKRCFQLKNLLMDIERIGDMSEDIAQMALMRIQDNVTFSPAAVDELGQLWKQAQHTYIVSLKAFETSDKVMAKEACDLESEFDRVYWQVRHRHIERLDGGVCNPEANVIFTEVLRLLERVSDHADNLGVSVMRS
jgi:phosphate:Na+ symporter